MNPTSIFETFLETTPTLAICLFAIHQITKKLWSTQDDLVNSHKDRIEALEKHTEECDKDRVELHRKHERLQNEVVDTLTKLIKKEG